MLQWAHKIHRGPSFLPAVPPQLCAGGGLEAALDCSFVPVVALNSQIGLLEKDTLVFWGFFSFFIYF